MIIRILKKIFSWFKEHKLWSILGALGIGSATAGVGVYESHQAKKTNKKAIAIQQEAINRHEIEYNSTCQVLAELGEMEKLVVDSFPHFADIMAQIQGRPQMKTGFFSTVKLPNYEPNEIKTLSIDMQMAIGAAGGAGIGAMAGVAAFGAGAIIAAPAMISAGIVLCVKGVGLKKKAIENVKQAKKLRENVEEIIKFYGQLRNAASSFRASIGAVYQKYAEYLPNVQITLQTKSNWKEFSKAERKSTENVILLARLLYEMCNTNVVVKSEKEDKLESINAGELEKLEKQAVKLLAGMH